MGSALLWIGRTTSSYTTKGVHRHSPSAKGRGREEGGRKRKGKTGFWSAPGGRYGCEIGQKWVTVPRELTQRKNARLSGPKSLGIRRLSESSITCFLNGLNWSFPSKVMAILLDPITIPHSVSVRVSQVTPLYPSISCSITLGILRRAARNHSGILNHAIQCYEGLEFALSVRDRVTLSGVLGRQYGNPNPNAY